MGLIILENKGYQEYQDELARSETAEPAKCPADRRWLLPFSFFTVILVISVSTAFLLFLSGRQSVETKRPRAALPNPAVLKQISAEGSTAAAIKGDSLWRCKDGTYTNTPWGSGQCQYLGAEEAHSEGNRYITQNAPRL